MSNIFPGAKVMQGKEWGFPQGSPRPVPPSGKTFSVIHITGNSRLPSAEGEATWRINDPANQNSATFFVNRDGSVVQFLSDPLHMDPWSNGDVNQPDLSNRRIAQMVADRVNANERTLLSIENVGFEPGDSITQAQKRTCGKIIAHYHKAAGVAINRTSVIGHYQLNSVTRPNCPAKDKGVLDEIVAFAREAAGIQVQGEDPAVIQELEEKLAACKDESNRRRQRIIALEARRDALMAAMAALQVQLEEALVGAQSADELRARIRNLRSRIDDIKAKVAALADDIADD